MTVAAAISFTIFGAIVGLVAGLRLAVRLFSRGIDVMGLCEGCANQIDLSFSTVLRKSPPIKRCPHCDSRLIVGSMRAGDVLVTAPPDPPTEA